MNRDPVRMVVGHMTITQLAAPPPDAAPDQSALWYLVQTHAGKERLAKQHLERQSFAVFLPLSWRTLRHGRALRTAQTAYFPGYLFVSINIQRQRWRSVDGTIGVIRLVKIGDRPTPAPQGLIAAMRDIADRDGVLDLAGPELVQGTTVRLIRGPFADQLALVDRQCPMGRVRVLLTMMNQSVPVQVDRADLAKI
jgi:transcriptional antiterminator RfaH